MSADSVSKSDLVKTVARNLALTQADTEAVVDSLLGEITTALAAGKQVRLPGFGIFVVRERAARQGRNPATGASIDIAASKSPAFKPGKDLKAAVA